MFKNILNTIGTRFLSAVVNLLIAIILSQFLGPEGKGGQGLIITTITFILVFSNLVGGATLVYFAPRYPLTRLLLPSYLWTILISLICFPILWFFKLLDQQFILHVCVLSILSSFTAIHTSLLIGKEKIAASNITGLLQPVMLLLSLGFFFFFLEWVSLRAYISGLYLSFAFSLLVSLVYLRKVTGPLGSISISNSLKITLEMFRLGAWNQVAHITQMLSFRLSFYVLDTYHGESAVGVYSNGISLAESVWLIAKSISLVQYSSIANSGDRVYAQGLTVRLIKVSLLFSLLVLLPLLLFPSSVYAFVFGNGFSGVREVIWALAAGVLIYVVSILIGHYFSGTGRYRVNAMASSLGLVVSAILFFSLIPPFGVVGAGAATSISYFFTTFILMIIFIKDNPGNFRRSLTEKYDMKQLRNEITKLIHRK